MTVSERFREGLLSWCDDGGKWQRAKDCTGPLETGKDKAKDSLLESLERNSALVTCWMLIQ